MPQNQSNTKAIQLIPIAIGLRILAFLIDLIPVAILAVMLDGFLENYFRATLNLRDGEIYNKTSYYLANRVVNVGNLMIAIGFAYHTILEQSSWKGSLAKRLLGIKVLNEQGENLTFRKSFIRNLGKSLLLFGGLIAAILGDWLNMEAFSIAGGLAIPISWIGLGIQAHLDAKRQFFYDKWAATFVLKV